jgi:hypothetical protein
MSTPGGRKPGGVTLICDPASHTVLLIGSDPGLIDQAGELLNVV